MAGPEKKIVEFRPERAPLLRDLNNIDALTLRRLAENYSRTWANSGVYIEVDEAEKKIALFNPNHSYMILEPGTGIVIAQIHTIPAYADSIIDFVSRFSSHRAVVKAAGSEPPDNANFIVCFSLNCKPGYYIQTGTELTPLPRFVVENFPNPNSAYKIGYSFITADDTPKYNDEAMLKRYLKLLSSNNTRSGGPAMMHEAFGGIVVAFLPHARPENGLAAGGITLVVYPKSPAEFEIFEEVKENRRNGKLSFLRRNGAMVLTDINFKNL